MENTIKNPELELGDRRDFWNTNFNPISGYPVPHVVNKLNTFGNLKAEY